MDVESLERSIRSDISSAASLDDLEAVRIRYLGRRGQVTAMLKGIKEAPTQERPRLGAESNRLKQLCESMLESRRSELGADEPNRLYEAPVDGTLPASDGVVGHRHVLMRTFAEMREILRGMGYRLASGPQVEMDYYNFQALNFPEEHSSSLM